MIIQGMNFAYPVPAGVKIAMIGTEFSVTRHTTIASNKIDIYN